MDYADGIKPDHHAANPLVASYREQFLQLARRLSRAAREIEIVNRMSGRNLFHHELKVGRSEAAAANRFVANLASASRTDARKELMRLKASAENVEEHAWRGTVFFAHSIGEVNAHELRNGLRRGLFMELVMLRSASRPVPRRLIDKYMTNAHRAELFMKLLAA